MVALRFCEALLDVGVRGLDKFHQSLRVDLAAGLHLHMPHELARTLEQSVRIVELAPRKKPTLPWCVKALT